MKFVEYNAIFMVKKAWKTLLSNSNINDVYRSYEFFCICFNYRISSISNIKKRNIVTKFIVCYDNGIPRCIAPIILDKTPQKYIRLLGHGTNAGTLDFIYDENDRKYAVETFHYIKKKYVDYCFEYVFVPEYSPICDEMNRIEVFNNYDVFCDTFDSFFSSLSKSTRQNIRTSYNRLEKDGKQFQLRIYRFGDKELENIIRIANDLYQERRLAWDENNIKLSTKTIYKIYKRDVVYQTMRKISSSLVACLFIDEELAAFFMGYENEKHLRIPRLAIDGDYSRYSPGMIMICEYLKRCPENYHFDLGRGDESYKSKLNGRLYKSFLLKI